MSSLWEAWIILHVLKINKLVGGGCRMVDFNYVQKSAFRFSKIKQIY